MNKVKVSNNSRALVTGAGSGIGRAFAQEIAARHGRVICADKNLASAQQTVDLIVSKGGWAVPWECDVSVEQDVKAMAVAAPSLLDGPVDLLVNNAGVGLGGGLQELTLDQWRWCLDINLWGVIYGCHYFLPQLKENRKSGLINVASAASFGSLPDMVAYNVSKAGVLSLSETLHAELMSSGVHVNVVCPTLVPTNILNNGDLPEHMRGMAGKAMQKLAFTTALKVATLALDRMDSNALYTVPQPDAKLVWALKRMFPASYAHGMGMFWNRFKPFNKESRFAD